VERGADIPIVVGEKTRLLGELPEIRIAPAGVDGDVGEVAGGDRQSRLAGETCLVDDARKPDVIDPDFQRVAGKNRIRAGRNRKSKHSDGQLLNGPELWRTHPRIKGAPD